MRKFRARMAVAALAAAALSVLAAGPASSARLKDLVDVGGQRGNQLTGYGLVVGLNGTGDSVRNSPFTEQAMVSMMENYGVGIGEDQIRSQNVAAVMVTATLPPFARTGSRIDIKVSTMGDADSLRGGTLIQTPLKAGNGNVYVVAQGAVSAGGFQAEGQAQQVTSGVPTVGMVPNGGIVEREVNFRMNDLERVTLALRDPDFTTAIRIADKINERMGEEVAKVSDSGTVRAKVPSDYEGRVAEFMGRIENLQVQPDQPARVVVDSSSGTVVIGGNVTIDPVAVSQGNLQVTVTERPEVEQPGPLSPGDPVTKPRTDIDVNQGEGNKVAKLDKNANLQDLVDGLNSLGVGPRDLIPILRSIDSQGALNAELVIQ